jgi:hypothetical protein
MHCAKCGSIYCSKRYNPGTDMLDYRCCSCGYAWSVEPLDWKHPIEIKINPCSKAAYEALRDAIYRQKWRRPF